MIAHLEVLSWRPGQWYERWERPAPGPAPGLAPGPGLADGVLLELEDGEEECEERGAGSESDSEAILQDSSPLEFGVNLLVEVYSP